MRHPYLFSIALASALVLAGVALASGSTATLASVGAWSAFGGTANDGNSVCGMIVKDDATGRYLMIKHFADNPYATIQATRPSWHMQKPVTIDVYMKLDTYATWQGKGTAYNNMVEWEVRQNNIVNFIKEFQSSSRLVVGFPQGTEAPWIASLHGSAAIANVWMRCILDTQSAAPAPALASPAPASPVPTSPAPVSPPQPAQAPNAYVRPDIGA